MKLYVVISSYQHGLGEAVEVDAEVFSTIDKARKAIRHKGMNTLENYKRVLSCDDFSKAMSWRWSFYDKVGSFQRVDSCVNKMASDLSLLAKNEESDKQLVEKFEKELEIIEKIKSLTKRPTGTLLEYSENVSSLFSKLYELDDEISKTVLIEELHGSERVKLTLCDVWGEGLLDYPKAKTKVIKITAKDYVFIDLKDNLNKLSD